MLREKLQAKNLQEWNTDAKYRGGIVRSSDEVTVMEMEQRDYII